MRSRRNPQSTALTLVNLDERVSPVHPLGTIKRVADDVLYPMSGEFDQTYSKIGRASVPPESLLKSLLLIFLYSMRSERAFCEELDYNLLYGWFLDMARSNPAQRQVPRGILNAGRRRSRRSCVHLFTREDGVS